MGQARSRVEPKVQCSEVDRVQVAPDEFVVALDSKAFDFHMVQRSKTARITRLGVNGQWTPVDGVFSDTRPYEDDYVVITPKEREVSVTVKRAGVDFLYQPVSRRVKSILCHAGKQPVVYMRFVLRRQKLATGETYTVGDDSFVKCGDEYLLLINTPGDPNGVKAANGTSTDKILDPSLLFFAMQPVQARHHN